MSQKLMIKSHAKFIHNQCCGLKWQNSPDLLKARGSYVTRFLTGKVMQTNKKMKIFQNHPFVL